MRRVIEDFFWRCCRDEILRIECNGGIVVKLLDYLQECELVKAEDMFGGIDTQEKRGGGDRWMKRCMLDIWLDQEGEELVQSRQHFFFEVVEALARFALHFNASNLVS